MSYLALSLAQTPACKNMKNVQWVNHSHRSKARRIAVASGTDSVWVIGIRSLKGGYSIERYHPITKQWHIVSSVGAVRLSVTPSGDPAVITDNGNTFMKKGKKWVRVKGCAKDLAFGHNG